VQAMPSSTGGGVRSWQSRAASQVSGPSLTAAHDLETVSRSRLRGHPGTLPARQAPSCGPPEAVYINPPRLEGLQPGGAH
jgi:hypothetical protein